MECLYCGNPIGTEKLLLSYILIKKQCGAMYAKFCHVKYFLF